MKTLMKYSLFVFSQILLLSEAHTENNNYFSQKYSRQGITFYVSSKGEGSFTKLQIIPSGLSRDNQAVERDIEGRVTGAEIADLNSDGSPEIYIYVTSASSGSYGSLIAYSANHKRSLSEINMPNLLDDPKLSHGYMGHDEFSIVGNSLRRRFPLYEKGDTNDKPSGGHRQLEYKLEPGEASWLLKIKRSVDFK